MATRYQRRRQLIRDCTMPYCGLLAFCIFLFSSPNLAHAASPYELAPAGTSKIGHLGFQMKWQAHWLNGNDSYLDGYWGASAARGMSPSQHNLSVYSPSTSSLGLAAMLRYQRKDDGTGFYAEAGTG